MSEQITAQLEEWEARYATYKADFEKDGRITPDEAAILQVVSTKLVSLRARVASGPSAAMPPAAPPAVNASVASQMQPPQATQPPMPTAPPNPHAGQVLKNGASGDAVKHLQNMLNAQGAQLSADGLFGPATARAVAAFQKGAGVTPDGVVGSSTWQALDGQGAGGAAAPQSQAPPTQAPPAQTPQTEATPEQTPQGTDPADATDITSPPPDVPVIDGAQGAAGTSKLQVSVTGCDGDPGTVVMVAGQPQNPPAEFANLPAGDYVVTVISKGVKGKTPETRGTKILQKRTNVRLEPQTTLAFTVTFGPEDVEYPREIDERDEAAQKARQEAQAAMGKCNYYNSQGAEIQPAAQQAYSKGFALYSQAEEVIDSDPAQAIDLYKQSTAAFAEGDALQAGGASTSTPASLTVNVAGLAGDPECVVMLSGHLSTQNPPATYEELEPGEYVVNVVSQKDTNGDSARGGKKYFNTTPVTLESGSTKTVTITSLERGYPDEYGKPEAPDSGQAGDTGQGDEQEVESAVKKAREEAEAAKRETQMAMAKCNGCNAKGTPIKPAAGQKYSQGFSLYTQAESAMTSNPAQAADLYRQSTAAFREGDALQG